MTLGLVLGPVSATVQSSYATEVSTEKSDIEKALKMIDRIKGYEKYYDQFKEKTDYRLANSTKRAELDKAIKEASDYAKNTTVDLDILRNHISNVELGFNACVSNSSENQKNLKIYILASRKLLAKNESKKDPSDYKSLEEKINNAIDILKIDKIGSSDYDKLLKANKELVDSFEKAKEKFADTNTYSDIKEEELSKLDEELNKESKSSDDFKKLLEDRKKLIKTNESFKVTDTYIKAGEDKKKAYEQAFEDLKGITDLTESSDNYKNILEKLRKLAQAKYDIDGQDLNLNTIKVAPNVDDNNKEIEKEIKNLRAYINDKANINKILFNEKFKDEDLKKSYNEAYTKALNVVLGKEKLNNLKDYQDLSAKLKKLSDDIKAKKISEEPAKPLVTTKLDKLKDDIKKAEEFTKTKDFESASEDYKKKLNEEIEKAKKLTEKSSVTDDEASKASEAIKAALANFTKFADKSKAKEGLEKLLKITDKVKIDQIYGKDQKELRDAYVNARENAEKSVKDFENKSLDDMQKSYDKFLESVNKLYEFLVTRLKNKVAEEKKFRETDTYKEALKDSKKEEAIKNHKHQIEEAEKILNETAPEASKLDEIYKKLVEARANIDKNMTDQVRKLIDAIAESQAFMKTDAYKKATSSSNKNLKEAAGIYKSLIEKAESFKKDDKLNTVEAEDLLDLINHTRDFIEGKISEKQYLNNKNYYILKSIKNHKNYKDINQASRRRLEWAMTLYEDKFDDDMIFRGIDEAMNDEDIQAFLNKMKNENNPNKTRNDLLIKLRTIVDKDEDFRKGEKYEKAPKKLKEDYDNALAEAKKIIGKENPTEKEVKDVYDKLKEAIDRIELRSIIDRRLVLLAEKFKKNQLKIGNPEDRKAIAAKINALQENPYTTIEDVDTVEKELDKLINTSVATTTVPSKPAVPQTVTPQSQTTFRPLSTITNPGSIVKTGIRGMAKVVGILVVALVIFKLTSKKGDKK